MLDSIVRTLVMVLTAAGIAAVVTLFTIAGNEVEAGPLAPQQAAAIKACTDRPWPYNTCVDTGFSKQKVRLVTTDRLTR
ncbi:MAG: hypothetical protein ACTHLO_16195 [Pseudolabrys sp.]